MIDRIIAELKAERDRIERAIAALDGQAPRTGVGRPGRRGRRQMSAEARRRISLAMKKSWASGKMKGNSKRA